MTDSGVQYEETREFVETGTTPLVSMFKLEREDEEVSSIAIFIIKHLKGKS